MIHVYYEWHESYVSNVFLIDVTNYVRKKYYVRNNIKIDRCFLGSVTYIIFLTYVRFIIIDVSSFSGI